MNKIISIIALSYLLMVWGCGHKKNYEKGFPVSYDSETTNEEDQNGINKDSVQMETKPSEVLLTYFPNIRLTTIYKVNFNKNDNTSFIGSNNFRYRYESYNENENYEWNNHIMPGFEAVFGYNLVNISHTDLTSGEQKNFFEKPALIKTLYYPSYSKDSLFKKPVFRNYFMVTAYNYDTNKDGFINLKDQRHMYLFDLKGSLVKALIPENYSVQKSEYDPENDYMYVFAQLDENKDGIKNQKEPIHIFWIDLKDPTKTGRVY